MADVDGDAGSQKPSERRSVAAEGPSAIGSPGGVCSGMGFSWLLEGDSMVVAVACDGDGDDDGGKLATGLEGDAAWEGWLVGCWL